MLAGLGVAMVLVVAGCAAPVPGTGSSASTSVTAAPVPASTQAARPTLGLPEVLLPPKVELPPRPRDVSVQGRDPCAVFTPQLANELGFAREPLSSILSSLNGAPGCTAIQDDRSESLALVFVTRLGGIDVYNRADVFDVDLEPLAVAGFPALLVRPRVVKALCFVAVDSAPGEMVFIQANEAGGKPTATQDKLCSTVRRVAEPVMEAVVEG